MYLFPLLRFCYIPPFPFPFVAISPVLRASGGVYFLINPWFLGMCSAIRGEEGGGVIVCRTGPGSGTVTWYWYTVGGWVEGPRGLSLRYALLYFPELLGLCW